MKHCRLTISVAIVFLFLGYVTACAGEARQHAGKGDAHQTRIPQGKVGRGATSKGSDHQGIVPGQDHGRGGPTMHHRGAGPAAKGGHPVVEHRFDGGRHFSRFTVIEQNIWRGGAWRNGCFRGYCGTWWVAGGYWHYYPDRTYPYPLLVSEIIFTTAVVEAAIVASLGVPTSVITVPSPAPAPAVTYQIKPQEEFDYVCDDPKGTPITVEKCNLSWRKVPRNPMPPTK